MRERKDDETEFVLYSNGPAYSADISDLIFAWQTASACKSKRKCYSGKFTACCSAALGE